MQLSRRDFLIGFLPTASQTKFSTDVKVVNVFAAVRDKKGQIVSNSPFDGGRTLRQPQRRQPPGGAGQRRAPGTVLYDSILLASDELMKKQAGRKALVLLTDGVDNGSKVPIERAIEAAQRADTLVYSVLFADEEAYAVPGRMGGYGGRRGGRRGGGMPPRMPQAIHPDGKKILRRISKETGGGFFEVSKKHPLDKIYDQIQEELRNQYNIGFSPGKSDGTAWGFRKIGLSTKQKGLIVQAREGYYPAQ